MTTRDAMALGMVRAVALGHSVAGWLEDWDEGYLAECDSCGRFMACDSEDGVWGHVATRRCSGRRMG